MLPASQNLILLEDLSQIVVSAHDLQETLDQITTLLAQRLHVEVCSIYLHQDHELVLRSTCGLQPTAVGQVRMAEDEGLTGLTFQQGEPVNVEHADHHPRYKFFPGIDEERFRSYLGVPLIHRRTPIGALVVQTREPHVYPPDTVRLLVTAASQLAGVIANARLLADHSHARPPPPPTAPRESFLRGIGVSPGVGQGEAYPLGDELGLETRPTPSSASPAEEREHFESALLQSIQDVITLRDQVSATLSEEDGAIFHAHLMMLEDRGLQEKIRSRMTTGESAVDAVTQVARDYIDAFLRLEDPYLRERAADVRDVAQRLLRHLWEGVGDDDPLEFAHPTIVVAEDLTPSRLVRLLQPRLVGVVLARGGRNSHTAILCRSAGIPAVVGLATPLPRIDRGQPTIVDGNSGLVYLSPGAQVVAEYARLSTDSARVDAELRAHITEPPITRDGQRVTLRGNAALISDLPRLLAAGAEGVGLYRTEFPFLVRSTFPDEEHQLAVYRRIIDELQGLPATLRTLDVGGDKNLPYLPLPKEDNPHLGWRSIRVSLEMEETFRIQIRALLRASRHGPVRIVFPMISTVEELIRAREIVDQERTVLTAAGHAPPPVPVGAMVEVPSAALILDRLAPHADFFSVGTNDLVQYLLAVDRANRRVAHLYDPLHPAVLGVLRSVMETAARFERPVSVCGEMASRGLGAAALLAVGVRELSVSPGSLPRVRRLIQLCDATRLAALADALCGARDAGEAQRLLRAELASQAIPATLWEKT